MILSWLKEKWKWIVGGFAVLFGLISIVLRSRNFKGVLEKANESHAKENKINTDAKEDLSSGMQKINEELGKELTDARDKHEATREALEKNKQKFRKEVKESGELAEKIADHLGATHVKPDS